jgi:hypothetical protein
MPIKECTLPDGGKGWKWGDQGHCYADRADAEKQAAAAHANGYVGDALAFDRGSVRRSDDNGNLHVDSSHISKAMVCPYFGREIPGAEELGLKEDRIYYLLRDPEGLKAAASTFNNLPILSEHVPSLSTNFPQDKVIGSTGTDAKFNAPYLDNSLVFWRSDAIASIVTDLKRELSCSYWFTPDMTPGVYEGEPYDGVMRNISGNHVALVEMGRAGPDVLVGDAKPTQLVEKPKVKLSQKAVAVKAAVGAHLRPLLAQDAAVVDLSAIVRDVKQTVDAKALAQKVILAADGKLAQFAKLDAEALARVIQLAADESEAEEMEDDDKKSAEDEDEEEEEKRKSEKKQAEDEPGAKGPEDRAAMDAAISKARSEAAKEAVIRINAIREAEELVAPHIGKVAAMDSADAIYKLALDAAKVDIEGVHPSAYRAMVKMLPLANQQPQRRMASDSTSKTSALLTNLVKKA